MVVVVCVCVGGGGARERVTHLDWDQHWEVSHSQSNYVAPRNRYLQATIYETRKKKKKRKKERKKAATE